MKARRIKRKKIQMIPPKNEEDAAQDNLFEISNFAEDFYIDESHILTPSEPIQHHPERAGKFSKQTSLGKNKSLHIQSFGFRDGATLQRIHHERFGQIGYRHLTKSNDSNKREVIFNSVESNNVFVGLKK